MIDSVVLKLEDRMFTFVQNGFFDAETIKHLNNTVSIKTSFSNAYAHIKKQGRYFPIITPMSRTIRRGKDHEKIYTIEIQASLPKLLHGTNIWEIQPSDLAAIYIKLKAVLKEVGVDVSIENLREAVLKRVDFSKLVRIHGMYGSARQVIKRLSDVGYKQRTEMRHRDYMDKSDGCALKFHNLTQGYCIYDKFGEVIANGYTDLEKEWIEWMKEHDQGRNLVRFEFSLQRQQSLDAFLRRRIKTKKTGFTLADVMDKELAKNILLEVFDSTFDNRFASIVTLTEMQENELERILIERNLSLDKHTKLSYLVNKAIKIGVQPTMQEIKARYSNSTFRRYEKDIAEIVGLLGDIRGGNPHLIDYLRQRQELFELITPRKR